MQIQHTHTHKNQMIEDPRQYFYVAQFITPYNVVLTLASADVLVQIKKYWKDELPVFLLSFHFNYQACWCCYRRGPRMNLRYLDIWACRR